MGKRQLSDYVLIVMKNLNLVVILYVAGIMASSLRGYVLTGNAMDFLISASGLPASAWKIPVMVLLLYMVCLMIMHMQSQGGTFEIILKICVELVIGFAVSYILGFGYMGIILLILADMMKYFPGSRFRFPASVIICLCYLLLNSEYISVYFDVIPFDTYLTYFQADARSVMDGLLSAFDSLNTFLFLVYMIFLLRAQLSENERILNLNRQLNETNRQLNAANSELQKANIQLEEYAREEEQMVATRERNRLAREIHDTLGHALTGIITGAEACAALMDVAPEAAKQQMQAITEVARQGITDVRRSVKALRPDALEKYDLEDAIKQTIDEMRRVSNVEIEYRCNTQLNCFNGDEEEVIYRIVQESITNSIRHGEASRILVDIERKYGTLIVKIKDNGKGCKNIQKGFGLHHMEERLQLLQGQLTYNGDDGFTVEAQIPIRWGETEEK